MSEHLTTTPDEILTSRAKSDGELVSGGAEYNNGTLKITPEQLDTIRTRSKRELGGSAVGSLLIHSPVLADLEYIGTDTAVENESSLRADVYDLMSRYEDAIKLKFPTKIGWGLNSETVGQRTSMMVDGQEVGYDMTFQSLKIKRDGQKVVVPRLAEVVVKRYDKNHYKTYGETPSRDTARFKYGPDGSIDEITLTTQGTVMSDNPPNYPIVVHDARPNEGIVPNALELIAPRLNDKEGNIQLRSSLTIITDADKAVHGFDISVASTTGFTHRTGRGTSPDDYTYHELKYRFSPETDEFVKCEGGDATGLARVGKDVYLALIKEALSNIPVVGSPELVTK